MSKGQQRRNWRDSAKQKRTPHGLTPMPRDDDANQRRRSKRYGSWKGGVQ